MKRTTFFPTSAIPVIPMRNMVVYPGQTLPIVVGRPRSRAAFEAAVQAKSDWIILVAQKHELSEHEPGPEDLFKVGVLVRIDSYDGGAERGYQILISSVSRFAITKYEESEGYLRAFGQNLEDVQDVEGETLQALVANMKELAGGIFELIPADVERMASLLNAVQDPALLTHMVAQHIDLPLQKKQELLEMTSLKNRLLTLLEQMVSL